MRRRRRTGWRTRRTARQPASRIRVPPRAAWASQCQTAVYQDTSAPLLPRLRALVFAGLGDEALQLLQLVGAGALGLEQRQHELVEGAVEDLVEEAAGDPLAADPRGVDEGAALGAVPDEPLVL